MKVAIYARVSTIDKEQNPENQLTVLRSWAKQIGYEEITEYTDYAHGGDSNRPEFTKMRMDARQNKFKGILVWSLDRFSREGILNTMDYIKDLGQYKVFLKSYQDTWLNTENDMMRDLLISIFAWVASWEKQRISERIKADINRRKALGCYKGGRPRKTSPPQLMGEEAKAN
jgi:DNA invertase Pin-like site-specific DNA recombinase